MTISAAPVTMGDLLANAAWTRRLARSLLHDGDAADDLVQETWMAALQARPDRDKPLRPWLGRVLRNRAFNRGRDDARREARHARAGESVAAASTDPEELVGRVQLQRLLAELVTQLPEPTRQTLLLHYYEGLTSEQIGETMAVAPGTVRRRLKEGVDALRLELDRRHEGRREDWLRALVPLVLPGAAPAPAPGRAGIVSAPKLAIALLVLVMGGLLLFWLAARRDGSSATLTPGGAAAAQPPGANAPGPTPGSSKGAGLNLAAAAPNTLESCRKKLAERRQELAVADVQFRRYARSELQFAESQPNPAAREALMPDLERIMRSDGGAGSSFTLECRTWVCKLLVLEPADAPRGKRDWMRLLQQDPNLSERLSGRSFHAGAPTRDPVSGAALIEDTVFLRLGDPSARRVPRADRSSEPVADTRPLPETLAACQAELAASERRLAHVRSVVQQSLPLSERFKQAAANPGLTVEVRGIVARILQTDGGSFQVEVECRGRVCRLDAPGATEGSDAWRRQLEQDDTFGRYTEGAQVGREVLYGIADPSRPYGMDLLKRLVDEFKRSPALATCAGKFPASGDLHIRFFLPDAERPAGDAPAGQISARFGGTLAGTPLGQCLEKEAARTVLSEKLPERVRGAVLFSRLKFPLPEPGLPATR